MFQTFGQLPAVLASSVTQQTLHIAGQPIPTLRPGEAGSDPFHQLLEFFLPAYNYGHDQPPHVLFGLIVTWPSYSYNCNINLVSAKSMMIAIGALLWVMAAAGDAAHGVMMLLTTLRRKSLG